MQQKVDESADTFKDNQQFVKILHTKIAAERSRVLGLSALVEQFVLSMKSTQDLLKKDLSHIGSQLLATSTMISSHDYDTMYSELDRKNIRKIRSLRSERQFSVADAHASDIQFESNFSTSVLISWMNAQSLRASSRRVAGYRVDEYLPKYEVITDWASVQTGQQLSRVVVTVILDCHDSTNTMLENYSKFGGGHGGQSIDIDAGFGISQLQEIQRFRNSPFFLVACCVQYAARFLNAPPFEAHGLRADSDLFKTFVTFLLTIANPVLLSREVEMLDKLSSEYVATQTTLGDVALQFDELAHLHNVHRKFSILNRLQTSSPTNANSFNPEGISSDIEQSVLESAPKSTNYAFEEDIIKSVYPLNTHGNKYEDLAASINKLIESDNYPQNIIDAMQKCELNCKQVSDLRNKLQVILNKKAEGSRLANDIRSYIISSTTEIMLRRLRWISEKLDAMPSVPMELA